jgi:ElaB/YqjD/DUF883 family membrane-anchored ribosome-binding protein
MESSMGRGMTESGASSHMTDDVVDLFTHAFGFGRSSAFMARDSANDAMENLKHKLADLKSRSSDSLGELERKVEQNPISSALIAFGVGFVVAKMFHHRRH